MREKIIIGLAAVAAGLLAWNMNTIFTGLPDELNQGAIYRIIYFHVPANILGMLGFGAGMLLSIGYLVTKDLRYDALAASVTEVSLVFASIGLATGSIWARIIWGVWWAWDLRLTSWLVCWLIFGLTWHRVEHDFVIQGGSPGANEYVGFEQFLRDELGTVPHLRGTVGMSTRGHDTGDAQWFVNLRDNLRLGRDYTVFAEVVSGIDVVDGILEGDTISSIEEVR